MWWCVCARTYTCTVHAHGLHSHVACTAEVPPHTSHISWPMASYPPLWLLVSGLNNHFLAIGFLYKLLSRSALVSNIFEKWLQHLDYQTMTMKGNTVKEKKIQHKTPLTGMLPITCSPQTQRWTTNMIRWKKWFCVTYQPQEFRKHNTSSCTCTCIVPRVHKGECATRAVVV